MQRQTARECALAISVVVPISMKKESIPQLISP